MFTQIMKILRMSLAVLFVLMVRYSMIFLGLTLLHQFEFRGFQSLFVYILSILVMNFVYNLVRDNIPNRLGRVLDPVVYFSVIFFGAYFLKNVEITPIGAGIVGILYMLIEKALIAREELAIHSEEES